MKWSINYRRIVIAIVLGAVFGIICVYGTMTSIQLSPIILATILYDRVLLGVVIGIAYGLDLHPLIRGGTLGAIVSLEIAIPSGIAGGALLLGAGIVYGILIDMIATKFS